MTNRSLLLSVSISAALMLSACASSSANRLKANTGPVQQSVSKYLSAKNFKAYAIQVDIDDRRNNEAYGFAYNMASQAAANQKAVEFCLQQALGVGERCVVYAEGNTIVFPLKQQ